MLENSAATDNNTSGALSIDAYSIVADAVAGIAEPALTLTGGDGYAGKLQAIALPADSSARDVIPHADCGVITKDTRGEVRADIKSGGSATGACDAGAYEFTELDCHADTKRRYDQGDLFIKSCDAKLDDLELNFGSSNSHFFLLIMSLFLWRRAQLNKRTN